MCNSDAASVSVIDGATDAVIETVAVGNGPGECAVNPSTGRVYVSNSVDNTVLDNVQVSVTPAVTSCTLSLEAQFTDGTLTLEFTLGMPEPATWNVWLTAQNEIIRLLSLPLAVTDPPVPVPFTLPFVPPLGTVGVLTTLTTPDQGIICSDFATVETGPVSEDMAASVQELQDVLLQHLGQ